MAEWIERSYGWKMLLGDKHQMLRIKPDHNTDMNAVLGSEGFKEHFAASERVLHKGYVDSDSDDYSLKYERPGGFVREYKKGDKFYCIDGEDGRFHRLTNFGTGIIELEVKWEE